MSIQALVFLTLQASIFLTVLTGGLGTAGPDLRYVLSKPSRLLRSLIAMNVLGPVIAVAEGLLALIGASQPYCGSARSAAAMSRLSAATVQLIAAARAAYSDDPVTSRKLDFLLTSVSRPTFVKMLHRATSDTSPPVCPRKCVTSTTTWYSGTNVFHGKSATRSVASKSERFSASTRVKPSCRGSAHCAEAALCSSGDCSPVTIWDRLRYWGNSTGPMPMLSSRPPVVGAPDSARGRGVGTYSRAGGPVLQPLTASVLTTRVTRRTKSVACRWLIWRHSPGGQRPAHLDGAPDRCQIG